MTLKKWVVKQGLMDFHQDKSHYLKWVDSILVQICEFAKQNIDDSKSVNRKWNLDDFEIYNSSTIMPAYQDSICKKSFPSPLKDYGLYELFMQLLMPDDRHLIVAGHLTALDLPAHFQEFDTVLELLASNETYDFWDFPTSMSIVDFVDIESKSIIKKDKVFIEEVDEIFAYPNKISVNGKIYKIIDGPKIRYSFIRKHYIVHVRRDNISSKRLTTSDIGMIVLDNQNKRTFVPLKDDGAESLVGNFTILPRPYMPYVSIVLALRDKNSKKNNVDADEPEFSVLPEISVYLANKNSQYVRKVQIIVSNSYLATGVIRTAVYITEKDKLEMQKEVELQV